MFLGLYVIKMMRFRNVGEWKTPDIKVPGEWVSCFSRMFVKRRMFSLIIKLPPLAFFSLCFWIILSRCSQHDAKYFADLLLELVRHQKLVTKQQAAWKTVGRIILKGFIFRVMHHRLLNTYGHNTKSKEWFNTNWKSR
jgi:hypothetical protein